MKIGFKRCIKSACTFVSIVILLLAFINLTTQVKVKATSNEFEIKDGRLIQYNGNTKNVKVPSTVTTIGASAFAHKKKVESVTLPNTVTEIEGYAFWDANSLKNINIPDTVKHIGKGAFSGCTNLKKIELPESIDSIETRAFERTPWLSLQQKKNPLVIVNGILIDGSTCIGNVKEIVEEAFSFNDLIRSISIPDAVKKIGAEAFLCCSNLQKVSLPSDIISIERDTFYSCEKLEEIEIPNKVKSIDDKAFFNCINLEKIEIPEVVTYIGDEVFKHTQWLRVQQEKEPMVIVNGILIAVSECDREVIIPDTVTSISPSAFKGAYYLKTVVIPDTVTSIGSKAFYKCYNLTNITLPDTLKELGGEAFRYTTWMDDLIEKNPLVVLNGVLIDGNDASGKVVIPDTATSIGEHAFYENEELTSLVIPETVTYIDPLAIEECDNLENVHYLGKKEQFEKLNLCLDDTVKMTYAK